MAKYLFLGGAGFIGSSLIKELHKTLTSSYIYILEPSFANISRLDGLSVNVFRGELSNFDFLESIIKKNQIDTVVHLVSTLIPGSGYEDYKNEIKNIAFPTMRLTQLCSKLGVKFIYFSSGGTVYGNRKDPIPFKEEDKREPISYYGLTKLMLENNILFEHRTQGLNYLIIRPSNPFGPGQNINAKQGFIAVALGKILSGESIEVWGDGSAVRDYIYIEDLARIFVLILQSKANNTVLNIGSGQGYSINQLIGMIKNTVEEEVKVDFKPARNTDVSTMILSTKHLNEYVNYSITPIEEGVKKFYQYIRKK